MLVPKESSLNVSLVGTFSSAVGAGSDPAGITMIDSVKVYVKTKEAFGWPEEPDEFPEPAVPSKVTPPSAGITLATESDAAPTQPIPMTNADRLGLCVCACVCGSSVCKPVLDTRCFHVIHRC